MSGVNILIDDSNWEDINIDQYNTATIGTSPPTEYNASNSDYEFGASDDAQISSHLAYKATPNAGDYISFTVSNTNTTAVITVALYMNWSIDQYSTLQLTNESWSVGVQPGQTVQCISRALTASDLPLIAITGGGV